jgi:hypothetical protein
MTITFDNGMQRSKDSPAACQARNGIDDPRCPNIGKSPQSAFLLQACFACYSSAIPSRSRLFVNMYSVSRFLRYVHILEPINIYQAIVQTHT